MQQSLWAMREAPHGDGAQDWVQALFGEGSHADTGAGGQGQHWAQLLFGETAPTQPGSESQGQDWAQLLFG
jgi:hypothetical protein